MTDARFLQILLLCVILCACGGNGGSGEGPTDTVTSDAVESNVDAVEPTDIPTETSPAEDAFPVPPVELTPDLCDDPSKMALLVESMGVGGGDPSYAEINEAQVMTMIQAPTEGPFYMVNLIRYREWAEYPDGRQTDLTGREANALYSPIEFLEAIGARAVFNGEVVGTTLGEEGTWDEVAIVEYPCPLALFAMVAHPEFQARAVHKDAGLEASIVMVTHLQPLGDVDPGESPFPATTDDPAFELVRVFELNQQAQYGDDSDEPPRSGQEALDLYDDAVQETEHTLGIYPKARLALPLTLN